MNIKDSSLLNKMPTWNEFSYSRSGLNPKNKEFSYSRSGLIPSNKEFDLKNIYIKAVVISYQRQSLCAKCKNGLQIHRLLQFSIITIIK